MLFGPWVTDLRLSDWFLLSVSLLILIGCQISFLIGYFAQFWILYSASGLLGLITFATLPFGILTGIFGKKEMARPNLMIVGVISLLLLSWAFYWGISTVPSTDTTKWMKDGATALIGGAIGSLAYAIITKSYDEPISTLSNYNSQPLIRVQDPEQTSSVQEKSEAQENMFDVDDFCKSIIAWKVSATKKDEMFQLFRDNPYYLNGYLAYITKQNIEESKNLQKRTFAFMFCSIIVAFGSLILSSITLSHNYVALGLAVTGVVVAMIGWVSMNWKNFLKKET